MVYFNFLNEKKVKFLLPYSKLKVKINIDEKENFNLENQIYIKKNTPTKFLLLVF